MKYPAEVKGLSDEELATQLQQLSQELVSRASQQGKDPASLLGQAAQRTVLMAGAALPVTMYGQHVQYPQGEDRLPGVRAEMQYHPYRKAGSGVSTTVVYTDQAGEQYVLLGQKYKNPREKAQGLTGEWILPGGYMQPYPLQGHAGFGEDAEAKDQAEEALLRGARLEVVPSTQQAVTYDRNLEQNAYRELQEETGLDAKRLGYKPTHLSTRSDYGVTNDHRLHTIVEDYLFDYGVRSMPPAVKPGSDLGDLRWVRVRDIEKDLGKQSQAYGTGDSRYHVGGERIRDDHGEVMESAVHHLRDKELQALGTSRAAMIKHSIADPARAYLLGSAQGITNAALGHEPDVDAFGHASHLRHQEMLRAAKGDHLDPGAAGRYAERLHGSASAMQSSFRQRVGTREERQQQDAAVQTGL